MSEDLPYLHESTEESSRILSYQDAQRLIREYREQGIRVVLVHGVFDVLHIGHVSFFEEAKSDGGVLLVGIENDQGVRLNKGDTRPYFDTSTRLKMLSALRLVDHVFAFEDAIRYSEEPDLWTNRYAQLQPEYVGVSAWDPNFDMKRQQAESVGVRLLPISVRSMTSSTRLIEEDIIGQEEANDF